METLRKLAAGLTALLLTAAAALAGVASVLALARLVRWLVCTW